MRLALAVALLLAAAPAVVADPAPPAAGSFEEEHHASVPRRIAREPNYVGEPRYALFLFGPRGTVRMWAVLDRTARDLPYHDLLYFDLDADGDLTDPGERFRGGDYRENLARAGMAMTIRVGDVAVPGTSRVHRGFRVSTVRKPGREGIWFSLEWCGRETVRGGAPSGGYDSTRWGKTPADAPILRPTAEGPLGFALWGGTTLRVGTSSRIDFLVGNPGSGPDTLCYLDDEFLDREKDRIVAVLHAKDREGRKKAIPIEMQAPC
jgi:hypothetical protein